MKRFILVHGWDGGSDKDWFPWIMHELKNAGYQVVAPALPDTAEPRKEKWIPTLTTAVGTPDSDTYFIGHSMGCQTILRYLEALPEGVEVGGALLVAGFVNPLINLEGPKEEEVATSWTNAPLDLGAVHTHLPQSIVLFSDDDAWVTLDNAGIFQKELGSEVVIEHARQHFNEPEEPAVLREALKLVS